MAILYQLIMDLKLTVLVLRVLQNVQYVLVLLSLNAQNANITTV
jgi:hypothetical protein